MLSVCFEVIYGRNRFSNDNSGLKKRGKFHYGYKKHHLTDEEGLVPGVVTTKASGNEIGNLSEVLDTVDLPGVLP